MIIHFTDLEGRRFCFGHRSAIARCVYIARRVFQVRLTLCMIPSRINENFCHASDPTCAANLSHIYHFYFHSRHKTDRQSSDYDVDFLWRVKLLLKFSPLHNITAMCSAILMLAFSICHYVADADYIVRMMAVRAMMKRKSFDIFTI